MKTKQRFLAICTFIFGLWLSSCGPGQVSSPPIVAAPTFTPIPTSASAITPIPTSPPTLTSIPTSAPTMTSTPTSAPTVTATRKPAGTPKPNAYIVIAQLNLWFHGPGCYGGFEAFNCSGKRSTPLEPALGHTYNNSDPKVIQQQIDWAADYGVDAFSLEWTTPRGIGTQGSLEDGIDDAFLKAPNLARIRWCIFYDTQLRMIQDPAINADLRNGINFDDPKIYNAFVSDFEHFATKYFSQPQHLKIDGRPVVFVYAAWQFQGNYAGAIKDARAKALAHGYDVYLVGDVLRFDRFDPNLASQFDANTATFPIVSPGVPRYSDMGKAAVGIDDFYQKWRKAIQGLKVVGRQDLVNFQPGLTPQEDNRLFDPSNQIYIPALNKDQVVAMAQVARNNAEPVGSAKQKLIWVNTWNNWPEATTIEPTANLGAKYPAGNYQFDMLEVMRDTFGAETITQDIPIPSGAAALPTPTIALMTVGSPFTGTWQGPDPVDGSTTRLSLVQTGNELTGTYSDSYSAGIKPPGFQGNGSGMVLSGSTSEMTFHLTRWDGAAAQAVFVLTLSNQNNTLVLGCSAGCPIVLQRQ
jgi:Glycosyltransferase WbsX